MNKTLNKWISVIENKIKFENAPFSEHEVIYLRKAMGPAGMKDEENRLTLRMIFNNTMPEDGYNITIDHQEKGINYLRENTYKKNGQLRKNNIFGSFERHVIDNYKEFKFTGLKFDRNGYSLPIYRCIATDGTWFEYTGTAYSMIEITNVSSPCLVAVS